MVEVSILTLTNDRDINAKQHITSNELGMIAVSQTAGTLLSRSQ